MNRSIRAACAVAVVLFAAPAFAATYTWNTTNSGNWNVASNWYSSVAPTSSSATSLYFGGGATLTATNNITNNFNLNALNFNNTAGTTTLSGDSLQFVSNGSTAPTITMSGAGTAMIAGNLVISTTSSLTVNATAGTLWLGTSTNGGAFTGSANIIINNTSGNVVWIPDVNAWSGSLYVNSGYVEAADTGGDLFGNSTILNVAANATFDFNTNGESMGGIAARVPLSKMALPATSRAIRPSVVRSKGRASLNSTLPVR